MFLRKVNEKMVDPVLVQKVDDTIQQLADTATKVELSTQISNVLSGSPKGTYATLAALQTAFPTGTTGVYIVTADGHIYSWSGSAWVSRGLYQAVGIADGAVTAQKTSFMTRSKNLFTKDTISIGGYYNGSGTWVANVEFNATDFIPVEAGQTYFTNVTTSYSNLIFYNASKVFLSSIATNGWKAIFIPPANAAYVKFAFRTSEDLDSLMVTKGTTKTEDYIPYGFNATKEVILTENQLRGITVSDSATRNLFDYSKVIVGFNIASNTIDYPIANSAVTPFIEVSGSHLFVSGLTGYAAGNDRLFAFYDENRVRLKDDITGDVIIKTWNDRYIPIPLGAKYFRFNVYSGKTSSEVIDLNKIQVELSQYKTPYVPYVAAVKKIGGKVLKGYSVKSTKGKSLLLFGDSVTETATLSDDGVTYTEGTRVNWATYTSVNLEVGQMWNYAKSGASYRDRTGVLERQKISHQITTAIANNRPGDIIVVSSGTNDGVVDLGDYATAMGKATLNDLDRTKLYESLRWAFWQLRTTYPNAVCFAGLPLQRADIEPPEELLTAITKMAKRYNFHLIDGTYQSDIIRDFEVWQASGRDLSDGLHPKTTGIVKMAKLYTQRILEVYK